MQHRSATTNKRVTDDDDDDAAACDQCSTFSALDAPQPIVYCTVKRKELRRKAEGETEAKGRKDDRILQARAFHAQVFHEPCTTWRQGSNVISNIRTLQRQTTLQTSWKNERTIISNSDEDQCMRQCMRKREKSEGNAACLQWTHVVASWHIIQQRRRAWRAIRREWSEETNSINAQCHLEAKSLGMKLFRMEVIMLVAARTMFSSWTMFKLIYLMADFWLISFQPEC